MKLRDLEDTGGGTNAAIGSMEVKAMTQHDLISWYFDYQTSRYDFYPTVSVPLQVAATSFRRGLCVFARSINDSLYALPCCRQAFGSNEEVQAEVVLITKIVQHLIRKEAVLVVVEIPARNAGEDDIGYAKRQQRERVLALNPNYTTE